MLVDVPPGVDGQAITSDIADHINTVHPGWELWWIHWLAIGQPLHAFIKMDNQCKIVTWDH